MKGNSFDVIEKKLRAILFSRGKPRAFESKFVSFLEMHHICDRERINDDFIEELNTHCLQKEPGIFVTRVTAGYAIVVTGFTLKFKGN